MSILRRLPRWFNRWYARAFGYFWIPCPICKRDFGGHEAAETLLREGGRMLRFDLLVCWRCEDAAKEANERAKEPILVEHATLHSISVNPDGSMGIAFSFDPKSIIENTAGQTHSYPEGIDPLEP